jgi:Uma2 family endonuclease
MIRGLKQRLDYTDYAQIPPDGKRWELLDGDVYVTPAPSPAHQRISKRLLHQLEAYFEARGLGEVFIAPIDVILTPHDVVQPDLVVVTDLAQISGRGIEGPPALVVEVLSPSTETHDRTVKARRCAALRLRHYWVVDPAARRLECDRESAGQYALVVQGEGDQRVTHADWPGLTISLGDLWR